MAKDLTNASLTQVESSPWCEKIYVPVQRALWPEDGGLSGFENVFSLFWSSDAWWRKAGGWFVLGGETTAWSPQSVWSGGAL